ncbi:hypothetical protein BH10PSE18_BH10PSE18_23880 [soil metagenome]
MPINNDGVTRGQSPHVGTPHIAIELPPRQQAGRSTTIGHALDSLNDLEPSWKDGDIFYVPPSETAGPALETVALQLGVPMLQDLENETAKEHAAHARCLAYLENRSSADKVANTLANAAANVVSGFATGALNFGTFTAVLNATANAVLGKPQGFAAHVAPAATWDDTIKQIGASLVGAIPASVAYAGAATVSQRAIAPAVASLAHFFNGRPPLLVPTDPALYFPKPALFGPDGHKKNGAQYNRELAEMETNRAEMAGKQAALLNGSDISNLKFGVPFFGAAHSLRILYQQLMAQKGHGYGAAGIGGLSALTSGFATAALNMALMLQKMGAKLHITDASGAPRDVPLFLPQADQNAILNKAPAGLIESAKGNFRAAADAYQKGVPRFQKPTLGAAAMAGAIYLATVPIDTLVPLGNFAAAQIKDNPAGAVAVASLTAFFAYAATYGSVGKLLGKSRALLQENVEKQTRQRMVAAFESSVNQFCSDHLDEVAHLLGSQGGQLNARQMAAIFDLMNQRVVQDMESAVRDGLNNDLDPGIDQRMLDAYVETSNDVRATLVAAAGVESIPSAARSVQQWAVLERLHALMGAFSERVQGALSELARANQAVNQTVNRRLQNAVDS